MDTWSGQIATTAEHCAGFVRQYLDQVVDVLPDGRRSLFRITGASATRLQVDRFTFPGEAEAWEPETQSWVEAVREEARRGETFPGCLIVEMLPVGGAEDRLLVTVTRHDALAADLCADLIAEIERVWPEARRERPRAKGAPRLEARLDAEQKRKLAMQYQELLARGIKATAAAERLGHDRRTLRRWADRFLGGEDAQTTLYQ